MNLQPRRAGSFRNVYLLYAPSARAAGMSRISAHERIFCALSVHKAGDKTRVCLIVSQIDGKSQDSRPMAV